MRATLHGSSHRIAAIDRQSNGMMLVYVGPVGGEPGGVLEVKPRVLGDALRKRFDQLEAFMEAKPGGSYSADARKELEDIEEAIYQHKL